MSKVNFEFVRNSFNDLSTSIMYKNAVYNIGLWKSEKILFEKYFNKSDSILDVGCGAGRTTFGLYELGYCDIQGIDISEIMVMNAKKINRDKKHDIKFTLGNVVDMSYADNSFDAVIFSFNGFMQIPGHENRIKALKQINRVLKPGGVFIFTTHNREDKMYENHWSEEKLKWKKNNQNSRLLEVGDMIIRKNNRETYMYVPTLKEVLDSLNVADFKVIECSSRSNICEESEAVQEFSSDCVFWVVKST